VTELKKSPFIAGLGLVWRRQSLLWWIFLVNFLLAGMGAATLMQAAGPVLDHSLQSLAFVHSFNPFVFASLQSEAHGISTARVASTCLILVFFVFMLFVEGGVLETYRLDRGLSKGEFFEASGRFFWRFVRLLILLLIALIPVGIVYRSTTGATLLLDQRSPSPIPGVWTQFIGLLTVLFLLQAVRLWFDMAQVRAVAEDERAIRRALGRAFKITFGNFGSLYWLYLRISSIAWLAMALLGWFWLRIVRPEWIGASFVITQVMVLSWLGTRLWQRASETIWYRQQAPAATKAVESAPLPLHVPTVEPAAPDFSI